MNLSTYIAAVDKLYRSGRATEHSYRGDLQRLLTDLCKGVTVTNEPVRIECGAPDYILTKRQIPVGYIEAKDVGVDLDAKGLKEQLMRYRSALENLIITDYLEFRFYRNSEPTTSIAIAEVVGGKVKPIPANFEKFIALITDFAAWQGQTITSAKKLASMMAGKARLLADVIEQAVSSDEQSQANTDLRQQLEAFKVILIHDITPKAFADLYAQTIAYGMFAARLHDPSPDSFSREEAAKLIPKSNPFLRKLFNSISGNDLDTRIEWIVDALADIFRATNIDKLLSGFGKGSGREDAFMHFYEDFLAQYDPKLRKSRGVWYTPDAVVRFIVRAVDDILKTEFGLPMGLADASTTQIEVDTQMQDKRTNTGMRKEKRNVHRVQVLDPATGTGTFLAEVVRQVHQKFEGQQGTWPQYVEQHLIPRLNGFELLMASYAMAHLKLDLVLRDTGYDMGQPHGTPNAKSASAEQQRLRVFLTNSLEEAHPDTGTLFASWLSQEANEANAVKRDTPVMVVLGNPPYAVSSRNKGEWIQSILHDYKEGLQERKINLDDDYIKFLRYGQHLIDRTGEGVLAFITNNSFLDGITHRVMRKTLLSSFDKIHVINLHGYTKIKEVTPDGLPDENVFDIQQGVAITLLIKSGKKVKQKLAEVYYHDLFGDRLKKYDWLYANQLTSVKWVNLNPKKDYYFFVPRNYSGKVEYDKGTSMKDLFPVHSTGIETQRDSVVIQSTHEKAQLVAADFLALDEAEIRKKYFLDKDGRDWKVSFAKADLARDKYLIGTYSYRPFDDRFAIMSEASKGIMAYPRWDVMGHLTSTNFALVAPRQTAIEFNHAFICKHPCDGNLLSSAKKFGSGVVFPLYLYPETTKQSSAVAQGVQPNLDAKLIEQLAQGVGLAYTFKPDALFAHGSGKELTPLDVLDYCYAALHSPAYRTKYKEFLKSDFPRIPFPTDAKKFRALVQLGAKLRQLHLLEWGGIDKYITTYPIGGSNEVARKMSKKSIGWEATKGGKGRVWINDDQYFDGVPEVAWNFYIGGYQPAQKWLKDRHSRTLTFDDIRHYQRMIVALTETGKVMEEVDRVGVLQKPSK